MIDKFKNLPGSNPYGNQNKLLWHMDRLCEYSKHGTTFPFQVELNPTNFCNMDCRWCITKEAHRNAHIDILALLIFLKDFKAMGGLSIDWTGGGEPTAYHDFKEVVAFANGIGLEQGLMTNGFFSVSLIPFLESMFRWVRVSLDCVNPEDYAWMKQTSPLTLDVVLKNIRELCSKPKRPRVIVNVNLAKWNMKHLVETTKIAKELGADGIQVRPVLPHIGEKYSEESLVFYREITPVLNKLKIFESDNFQVIISGDKFNDIISGEIYSRPYANCDFHNFVFTLNANGDVCVCTHHLYDDKFTFGNIYWNSLEEIWEGEKRAQVIKHCTGLDFGSCQTCCKLHEGNKFLHFMKTKNPSSDPNFV